MGLRSRKLTTVTSAAANGTGLPIDLRGEPLVLSLSACIAAASAEPYRRLPLAGKKAFIAGVADDQVSCCQ
jgi:hypothetical protein